MFYGTSIPTVILVFKKCRVESENILFIDASNGFEKRKNQNYLTDKDLEKIMTVYKNRENIDKYAYVASLEEIEENEYNLNIPRYVDTFEEEVDIKAVAKEIQGLESEMKNLDDEILKYCKEFDIEAPIGSLN
ncbi:MAG: N-6 DNA methylase [bacterium]|nr:N-6 DNA methylase [bacterium]